MEQLDSPGSPNPLAAADVDIVGRFLIVQIGMLLQVGAEGLLREGIQRIVGTLLLVHQIEILGAGLAVGLEPEVALRFHKLHDVVSVSQGSIPFQAIYIYDILIEKSRKLVYAMPFEIVRNDITNMHVDAIVNTANPKPVVGSGTDTMIHKKAGPELLAARQKIGSIDTGCAAITPAFNLQAKYVIHTVGPVWDGGSYGEEALLRNCYDNSLKLALEHHCKSIAFPLISTGNYGFPKDKALQIAISAFSTFLLEHEMQIYLVVFDRTSFKLSEKLFQSVASYIDEHYVEDCEIAAYGAAQENRRRIRRRRDWELEERMVVEECTPCYSMPMAPSKAMSLEDMLKQADAGFTETLLKLIDDSGKKDSEIYKKALLSKQHFSKIRNNPNYKPTKPTAIALALALELDLDATKDLIGRAGYALTNSSKFDLIIRYCIENKKYNVVEINTVLYEFDQNLLGA